MSTSNPHQAIILLKIEVHELLQTGECSGNPLKAKTLSEFGLKPSMVLGVKGDNMDDCLIKLKRKIEAWNEE